MKPIIVGMNNPYSKNPEMALYPHPVGSSGYRLCAMFLDAGARARHKLGYMDYVNGFTRINMIDGDEWFKSEAKANAPKVIRKLIGNRAVICGGAVRDVLGLKKKDWRLWYDSGMGFEYALIPHPSGLTREYNDAELRRDVGDFLFNLWLEGQSKV